MKYKNVSNTRQLIPSLHIEAGAGEIVESDVEIANPNFVRVKEQQPVTPAKEA